MKVLLAGYNIDKELIDTLPNKKTATPETLSAAYARISRSKKSVDELRKESISQIEKARNSNAKIIYQMGHSSIAEHAVFNFDLIGVSRLLAETIQKSRLASFTEKSQRYVTLDGDYVIPQEIKGKPLEKEFIALISEQNQLYEKMFNKTILHLKETGFSGSKSELEGKAKEDARYILSLATESQMGMTINARSLAILLRRLDALDLAEARELKETIEAIIKPVAPSLIRYTDKEEFTDKLMEILPELDKIPFNDELELLGCSNNPEDSILTSLLFEKYGYDIALIMLWVNRLSNEEKAEIFDRLFAEMKSFHSMPRAFEVSHFAFQITMSSSCYAQMKRHRMCTIIRSDYNPERGYIIPPILKEIGMQQEIDELMEKAVKVYSSLEEVKKGLGNYIMTNASKVSIIFEANLRELYHFSRLRSDNHAQWEIQEISRKIEKIMKEKAPLAAKFLKGKHEFVS